jgi:hypothetical protein
MEAVITAGDISVLLDSRTRIGGEELSGAFTVGSSTNGLIRFDGAVDGPVKNAKGWYFSLGAYVNNDPTNVNAPNRMFVDRKQIYNMALSRKWTNSTLTAAYRFSMCNDNIDGGYSFAPFVYNGDGTISALDGFRLGRDCYFTEDDAVSYMEVRDGRIKHASLGDMDHRYLHDVSVMFEHGHHSGWDLDAKLHVLYMQPCRYRTYLPAIAHYQRFELFDHFNSIRSDAKLLAGLPDCSLGSSLTGFRSPSRKANLSRLLHKL